MRRLEIHPVKGKKNSLHQWWRIKNPVRVAINFIVISLCRIMPSLNLKAFLLRLLGVKIGKNTAFGLMSMIDIFFPELVEIGENCILGYNSVILGHEFLIDEWRIGKVIIEDDVMIGANATILAGVRIGKGAIIGAGAVVHRDVEPGSFVVGSPMQVQNKSQIREQLSDEEKEQIL